MAPKLDVLAVGLRKYTECHLGPAVEFLPRDLLESLITTESVTSTLRARDGLWVKRFRPQMCSNDNLVKLVTQEARAIFAILVILDRRQFTKRLLIEQGLRDEQLPLSIGDHHPNCTSFDGKRQIQFLGWSQPELMDFVNRTQWLFLAPVIKVNGETITLHEKCPLPFIGDGDDDPASGGGGTVYKTRVHPAHQEGFEAETTELKVAVKEFHRRELFEQENEILGKIKDLRHAHVIRHLTSIVSGGKKAYSIFPWTDSGTLQDFWRTETKELTEEHVLWALQQMNGLASAIQALHEVFKCRHGDLKPQNILCFKEGDSVTFKVADFGISKIHDMPTIYRKVATTNLSFTASYQGPEIEFDRVDPNDQQPRSRKYDIWSLGCVFLEFCVWLLHGPETMAGFENARQTSGSSLYEVTDRERKRAKVHHLAHGTVGALLDDPRCTGKTALTELLHIIGDRMLRPEVGDRSSAEEIANLLSDMIDRYHKGTLLLSHNYSGPTPQLRFDKSCRLE